MEKDLRFGQIMLKQEIQFRLTILVLEYVESWGFRDFILRLSVPCVNFYSECNYSGMLFQLCQGEQTKKLNKLHFEIKSILMGPGIKVTIKDPYYFGGVLQEFSSSQLCIESYNFPKYVNPP